MIKLKVNEHVKLLQSLFTVISAAAYMSAMDEDSSLVMLKVHEMHGVAHYPCSSERSLQTSRYREQLHSASSPPMPLPTLEMSPTRILIVNPVIFTNDLWVEWLW